MKNFIIIAVLCLFCVACAKEIPEPDVVQLQVYSTKIKYTNLNEPDILYWYLRKANKGGYFYITSTKDIKNFSDYNFTYTSQMPEDLFGKSSIQDIVVFINQLNGDMFFDITGKTASTTLLEE